MVKPWYFDFYIFLLSEKYGIGVQYFLVVLGSYDSDFTRASAFITLGIHRITTVAISSGRM